ncbi:hypothetical protein ACNRDB_01365, partial [Ralstonia pseudosolanacearum]|uniref:hypothetical protein n=1 Tax=Ralstonia pseudosolanacearum TaxID=1310165 RepID=UPI003AAC0420
MKRATVNHHLGERLSEEFLSEFKHKKITPNTHWCLPHPKESGTRLTSSLSDSLPALPIEHYQA